MTTFTLIEVTRYFLFLNDTPQNYSYFFSIFYWYCSMKSTDCFPVLGDPCTIGGDPGHVLGDIADMLIAGAGDGWMNVPGIENK